MRLGMTKRTLTRAQFLGVALASSSSSSAQMRLSAVLSRGMAIQRGVQVPGYRARSRSLHPVAVRPGSGDDVPAADRHHRDRLPADSFLTDACPT